MGRRISGNMSTSFHDQKRRENYVLQKSPGRVEKQGCRYPLEPPRTAPLIDNYDVPSDHYHNFAIRIQLTTGNLVLVGYHNCGSNLMKDRSYRHDACSLSLQLSFCYVSLTYTLINFLVLQLLLLV